MQLAHRVRKVTATEVHSFKGHSKFSAGSTRSIAVIATIGVMCGRLRRSDWGRIREFGNGCMSPNRKSDLRSYLIKMNKIVPFMRSIRHYGSHTLHTWYHNAQY